MYLGSSVTSTDSSSDSSEPLDSSEQLLKEILEESGYRKTEWLELQKTTVNSRKPDISGQQPLLYMYGRCKSGLEIIPLISLYLGRASNFHSPEFICKYIM